MKKTFAYLLAAVLLTSIFVGCGESKPENTTEEGTTPEAPVEQAAEFNKNKSITVISREDGSGTRGAFIELFGIQEKTADGEKVDMTTDYADITNSTSVMMTSVAQNPYAIGYISLGSLNNDVKALKVDGVEASTENVKNGSYKISRPFNIATKDDVSEVAQDFITYILSTEGQLVVEETGYIAGVSESAPFEGTKPSGKIVVAGSSSVTPVMEKLKETYEAINPNATIEVQQSDSTTGMTSVIDGVCDIGMASREVKDSELEKGLKPTVIALDGIAVIVNKENTLDDITTEQVKEIYVGNVEKWSEI